MTLEPVLPLSTGNGNGAAYASDDDGSDRSCALPHIRYEPELARSGWLAVVEPSLCSKLW